MTWRLALILVAASILQALSTGSLDAQDRQARRLRNFELMHEHRLPGGSPPSPRFDPDQDRQQFLMDGILVDVRTSIIEGHGLRRRIYQGSARNTATSTVPGAVLELLEAPQAGRLDDGTPNPGRLEVVASQLLGDLDPGERRVIALSLERPYPLLRLYRLRLRRQ